MPIVTEERVVEYAIRHPEASSSLLRWAAICRSAVWKSLAEVRQVFRHADQVGTCTVFNIMGNNYRLITRIDYGLQTVTIKHFLKHAEHDRSRWNEDC